MNNRSNPIKADDITMKKKPMLQTFPSSRLLKKATFQATFEKTITTCRFNLDSNGI